MKRKPRQGFKVTLKSGNTLGIFRAKALMDPSASNKLIDCFEYQMYNGALKTTLHLTAEAIEAAYALYIEMIRWEGKK